LGENIRKGREGRHQQTYRVGWLPIVTEASRACHARTNCDGGGSADVGNVRVRWETVTGREEMQMGVWLIGSQMECDQRATVG